MQAFDVNQDGILDASEVVRNEPRPFCSLRLSSDANWRDFRRRWLGLQILMYEEMFSTELLCLCNTGLDEACSLPSHCAEHASYIGGATRPALDAVFSAAWRKSSTATASCPLIAAAASGVSPSLSEHITSAPARMSDSQTSRCPCCAANSNAVAPPTQAVFTAAPAPSRL